MKIVRLLDVRCWDQQAGMVALAYWRRRGFTNAEIRPGLEVVGTRGPWLGNFTPLNMSKVRALLRMRPVEPERIEVELDVNSLGQQVTGWNRAYWRLEMIEVHRLVQGDSDIAEVWRRFEKDARRASILWAFSMMILGQR